MTWLPGSSDKELDDEIRFHLEMETEKNLRAGMDEKEARRAARRAFGGVRRTQEQVRDLRPTHALEMFVRDVVYGWRTLRHAPAYSLTSIVTLALAVGVCAAMMTFIDAALLRPLPYRAPERVMTLWETNLTSGENQLPISPANYLDWENQVTTFDSLALSGEHGFDIRRGDRVVSVPAGRVSQSYFRALGVEPLAGRTFEPRDYDPGAEPRVVLSESLWRDAYAADRSLVGRTIEIDAKPVLVLGIVPDTLDPTARYDIYAPLFLYPGERTSRTGNWMYAVGRLREGVTREQAQSDLDRVAQNIARENPQTNARLRVRLIPIREVVLGRTSRMLTALGGASICLLLLACANIAALTLARGAARRRELAVRAALGAHPSRIVRQLATESAILNLFAGAAAYVLAVAIVRWIAASSPEGLRRMDDVRAGAFTALIVLAFSLFATFLAGVLPAWRLVRSGLARDLESSRRDSGVTASEARLQSVLVVSQIALALLLLSGAGLLTRSLQRLTSNDLGFEPEGLATIQMYLYDVHPNPAERAQFIRTSLETIRALPGVTAAAATTALPFDPATGARNGFTIVGQPRPTGESRTIRTTAVTPGYFATMRTPLRAGRDFTQFDDARSLPVAILNEAAARRFWNGASPLGTKIRVGIMGPPREWMVVGVAGDTRDSDYAEDPAPQVFVPVAQGGPRVGGVNYVARAAAPGALLDAMQAKIWELTPSQVIEGADRMDRIVGRSLQARRFALLMIGGFGAAALLLSTTGLFGLLTYVAARRKTEIGVRMALGATPARIERLFVRRGVALALAGMCGGLALSFAFTRVLASLLYQTSTFDPVAMLMVLIATGTVTLFASWIPARRIASLQPSSVLRGE
jgi:putative ABC transport system permease protein